jgi:hypothetical protein
MTHNGQIVANGNIAVELAAAELKKELREKACCC